MTIQDIYQIKRQTGFFNLGKVTNQGGRKIWIKISGAQCKNDYRNKNNYFGVISFLIVFNNFATLGYPQEKEVLWKNDFKKVLKDIL